MLLLSQKPEGKAAHAVITVFLTYLGSILSAVRNADILQCFDGGGWMTGRVSGL